MMALSILGRSTALAVVPLGGPGVYVQPEIDPSRFGSPSAEPHHQPRTLQSRVNATPSEGNCLVLYR